MLNRARLLTILLATASAASARNVAAPDGAWSMELPETWQPVGRDEMASLGESAIGAWRGPADENKLTDALVISVVEKELMVSMEGREEFRLQLAQEMNRVKSATGLESGVVDIQLVRVADRDVYKVVSYLIGRGAAGTARSLKYYVPAGDKTFIFAFTAQAEEFKYRLIAFETMANSIRMRDGPPAKKKPPTDWRGFVTVAGIALAIVCTLGILIVARRTFRAATESP